MAQFNLNNYEEVKDRIPQFYADYPDGRIITELISQDGDTVMFKAFLYKDGNDQQMQNVWVTGYAEETRNVAGMANKHSHVENCETSAIGRALANAGYSGEKRPSREEMTKVAHAEASTETLSEAQLKLINTLIAKTGTDIEKVKAFYKVASIKDMDKTTASKLIDYLNSKQQ